MCFQPKVKTPNTNPRMITAPAPIQVTPQTAGVIYGGQDEDTTTGTQVARVSKDDTLQQTEQQNADTTQSVNPGNPSLQQSTQVLTEETAPTKYSQQNKRIQRNSIYR